MEPRKMAGGHWTLDDLPWEAFEASKVDPDLLKVVKAASLVEYNGRDYAAYLCGIFPDDPEFQKAAHGWAEEEVQHGRALARWAAMADPGFDFEAAFDRFAAEIQLPLDADKSVRGSRSGELVARCLVEVGTSSYYSALGEAAEEPLLKAICKCIAADELRHYKLFYTHLKRYLERERIGRLRRFWVAFARVKESEDDELAYAYYTANETDGPYDHERYCKAYMRRAYGFYRPKHIDLAVAMAFKAAGLNPQGRLARVLSRIAYRFVRLRWRRLELAGA